jgi:hypothetical protein
MAGVKITRLYGNWYYLESLPCQHEVTGMNFFVESRAERGSQQKNSYLNQQCRYGND